MRAYFFLILSLIFSSSSRAVEHGQEVVLLKSSSEEGSSLAKKISLQKSLSARPDLNLKLQKVKALLGKYSLVLKSSKFLSPESVQIFSPKYDQSDDVVSTKFLWNIPVFMEPQALIVHRKIVKDGDGKKLFAYAVEMPDESKGLLERFQKAGIILKANEFTSKDEEIKALKSILVSLNVSGLN